jgi:hypothetical protein
VKREVESMLGIISMLGQKVLQLMLFSTRNGRSPENPEPEGEFVFSNARFDIIDP